MSDDILKSFQEEFAKQYSEVKPENTELYGKLYGKDDLLAYSKYIDQDFSDPEHIKLIAQKLTEVKEGKIKRLMINMPPRHGKSQLASKIFPTWYLGNKPKTQIIHCSYSATIAENFTRWQRNICESEIYRDIFPELRIKQDSRAKDEWYTTENGVVIGAGIGGPITSRGADLAIIDDPIKNYEEARSETVKENVWEWFQSTFRTRLHPGAAMIIIMTRWVTDDLAGRLLQQDKTIEEGGTWHVLKLPAIDVKGKSLWQERYSIQEIKQIRKEVGEKHFEALYQQNPMDIQERIFNDVQFGKKPPDLPLFAYLDPAFGGKDYSALTIGGLHEENKLTIYIDYGEIWNETLDKTYSRVEQLCKALKVKKLFLESNQSQKALGLEFEKRGIPVGLVNNIENKHLRIINAVKMNWERIVFSEDVQKEYLEQITKYTEFSKHDDAPDSLAGLIERFQKLSGKNLIKRYSIFNRIKTWL